MSTALSGKEALLGATGLIVSIQMLGEVSPIATEAANQAKARVVNVVDTVVETGFDALPNPLDGPLTALNSLTDIDAPSLGMAAAVGLDAPEGDPGLADSIEKAILTPDDLQVAAAAMLDDISKEADVADDINALTQDAMAEAVEALTAVDEEDIAEFVDAVAAVEDLADVESMKEVLNAQAVAAKSMLGTLGSKGDGVIGTRAQVEGLMGSVGESDGFGEVLNKTLADGNDGANALKKVASALPSLGRSSASTRLAGIDAGGSGSAALIQAVANRKKAQIHQCYQRAVANQPEISGQLGIQVSIANGRVQATRTSTNQTGDPTLESCVNKRIRAWRFPSEVEDNIHLLYAFQPN